MAIKRVLLPVSGERSFKPLADAAFYMGEKFSAQVMGLFVQAPALVIPVDDFVSVAEVGTIAATAQERRREAVAKADSMFKAAAERFPHVESAYRSVTGDVEASFVRHGRLADVSVIAQPDPLEDGFWGSSYWLDMQNAMLFRSGRPVLMVPPQAGRLKFETVVIAWKQSLEAARAIAAAQPFMAMDAKSTWSRSTTVPRRRRRYAKPRNTYCCITVKCVARSSAASLIRLESCF